MEEAITMSETQRGRVVFRVDGSAQIGTGHVMRCLTLADALLRRGVQSLFLCRNLENGLARWIEGAGHRLTRLPAAGPPSCRDNLYGEWLGTTQEHDAEAVLSALSKCDRHSPIAIMVDHYGLDHVWETLVRSRQQVSILAIDDLNRRHDCAFLLDTTFGKQPADYEGLVPPDCQLMIGSEFALLRPDFARLRATSLERRERDHTAGIPVRNILVSMGGADPSDATGFVLDALEPLARKCDFNLHALIGPAYPHNDNLDDRITKSSGRITAHRNVRNVAELLGRMDLCIGAAGTSSWERCCMGLPTVNVVLAENQRTVADALISEGAASDGGDLVDGWESLTSDAKRQLNSCISLLINDLNYRRNMSEAARKITDGYGPLRVIRALLSPSVQQRRIHLRPANWEDASIIYEWQSYPETRRHAVNPNIPSLEEHESWMQRKLGDKNSSFYIPSAGPIPCGMVRLDQTRAPAPPNANGQRIREISILTAPEFYGCGVALRALRELQALHADEVLLAHVLPGNSASHALFRKANFEPYEAEFYAWSANQNITSSGTANDILIQT